MDLRQIRYFLELCEHRNFTHAASVCHVAQPSLTQAIRKLEEEIGGALFTRDRSGSRPTPLGQIVRPRFEAAMAEIACAEEEAARFVRLKQVPIRIGVMETVGTERLTPALAAHHTALPNIELELITGTSANCLDRLRDGWFDLAVGGGGGISAELFDCDPLYVEDYVVIFPKGHRFEDFDSIDIADIAEETLLDRPNCEMRDQLIAFCVEKSIELYAPYRMNDVETMKRLVSDQVGIAVLPRYSVCEEESRLALRPLRRPLLERNVCAIRARSQPMRRQAADLIRALKARCGTHRTQDAAQ